MTFELDRGIAVEASGPGEYAATLDPGWVVGGGLNGGYLLAVIGNAIRSELADVGQPDPVSVSAYYLTPTTPGPAVVRVRRSVRAVDARRWRPAWYSSRTAPRWSASPSWRCSGRSTAMSPEVEREIPPPDLPPVEECVEARFAPEEVRRIAPAARTVRHPPRPGVRRLGGRRAERHRRHPGLVQARRRPAPRPDRAAAGRGRAPAGHLRPGPSRLGTDARAHRTRARPPCSGLGDRPARHPEHLRWPVRGGLRGLGLHRPAGGAVAAAGAATTRPRLSHAHHDEPDKTGEQV